ncbi:hypothetical protein, partial [Elioraea sp.]|uniref:hypothetical protein n=1 Tax=Elioraea sp. TaxID=2185103 RepID=UPI003F6EC801
HGATLSDAKWAYATRRIAPDRIARLSTDVARAAAGDLLLAEVRKVGHHKAIQLASGRLSTLFPGDRLILAVGARYAPDQFLARAEIDPAGCELAAAGGIAGRVEQQHDQIGPPTALTPIALLADADGRPVNLRDAAIALSSLPSQIPTIAVVGTSMNSGKTMTVAAIVRGLVASGLRVGAAKITGTGAFGDPNLYRDAGAAEVLDFTDAGFATTFGVASPQLERIAIGLTAALAERGCDAAVLEIADGLYHTQSRALLASAALRSLLLGRLVFAATDAVSAVGGAADLAAMGLPPIAISGLFTRSPLAMAEAAMHVTAPILPQEALRAAAAARSLLGVAHRRPTAEPGPGPALPVPVVPANTMVAAVA